MSANGNIDTITAPEALNMKPKEPSESRLIKNMRKELVKNEKSQPKNSLANISTLK